MNKEELFRRKVAHMRKAQKEYFEHSKKGWRTDQEKQNAIKYCKSLEAAVDEELRITNYKPQTLL